MEAVPATKGFGLPMTGNGMIMSCLYSTNMRTVTPAHDISIIYFKRKHSFSGSPHVGFLKSLVLPFPDCLGIQTLCNHLGQKVLLTHAMPRLTTPRSLAGNCESLQLCTGGSHHWVNFSIPCGCAYHFHRPIAGGLDAETIDRLQILEFFNRIRFCTG